MKKYLKNTKHNVLLIAIVTGILFVAQESYGKSLQSGESIIRLKTGLKN